MRTSSVALSLLAALVPQLAAAAPSSLEAAFRKEYAFLAAQKRALAGREKTLRQSEQQRVQGEDAALKTLQRKVLALRSEADELEAKLGREAGAAGPQDVDRLAETLDRARSGIAGWGETLGKTPAELDGRIALLRRAFGGAAARLRRLGEVRARKGGFFLADGVRSRGMVIEVGGIAAFGVSAEAAGALAPAGQGRLQLWPQDAADSARALARGETLERMGFFLYESLEREVKPKKGKTLLGTLQAGGLIAWVIAALGALALLLLVARALLLLRAGHGGEALLARVERLVATDALDEARALCAKGRGVVAAVMRPALRHLDGERQLLEDAVSEAGLRKLPLIERFGALLMVIAAVAPLLGLLGTVTGMIATFDVITTHGTGDPRLLSGGIAEALITTELGLIVAIPTLLFGTLLNGRAKALEALMEQAAVAVLTARDRLSVDAEAEPEPPQRVALEPELVIEASL